MNIPFLDQIERFINERGSAAILKERLGLLQDQLVLHKAEFAKLQQENAALRECVDDLDRRAASQAAAEEFVEHRGALFKRKPGGGYHHAVYCPTCSDSTSVFPPGGEFNCTCSWFSNFIEPDLPRILSELP